MRTVSEQTIQQRIRLACSRGPVRLWRNNTGRLRDERGQLVTFGLCPGSSDLIGFRSLVITPEMVGQTVAVFAAVEVKSPTGRPTPEQTAFIDHVRAAGGLAGIARSVEDAHRLLDAPQRDRADTLPPCQPTRAPLAAASNAATPPARPC